MSLRVSTNISFILAGSWPGSLESDAWFDVEAMEFGQVILKNPRSRPTPFAAFLAEEFPDPG
jgi:hypothetical protein